MQSPTNKERGQEISRNDKVETYVRVTGRVPWTSYSSWKSRTIATKKGQDVFGDDKRRPTDRRLEHVAQPTEGSQRCQ